MGRPTNASIALAALSSATAATAAHLVTRRARRPKVTAKRRSKTRGCEPDAGPYLETLLSLPTVDGANQGIALSMLRDLIEEEGTLPEGYQPTTGTNTGTTTAANRPTPDNAVTPTVSPLDSAETDDDIFAAIVAASGATAAPTPFSVNVPYHEGLRSAVEVVLTAAMTLAMHDIDLDHECDDDECEASNLGPQSISMWHTLQTARRLLELAVAYEKAGTHHAGECLRCRLAGQRAPFLLRARLCRDLADDMITNEDDNSLLCHGVPVSTALDLAKSIIEIIENLHGIPAEVQLAKLTETLATRISVRESGLGD